MKRYIFLFISFLYMFSTVASGQARWNQAYQAYIDQYKDMAIEGMLKYGVPASITLAQGLLESGQGVEDLFFLVIITLVLNVMVGWVVLFHMMMMQKESVSVHMIVR